MRMKQICIINKMAAHSICEKEAKKVLYWNTLPAVFF